MKLDTKAVAATLNKILEFELAGMVRYTHYSLMIYGYNRIPIVSWLRAQATEGAGPRPAGGRADHPARRAPVTGDRPAPGDAQARHRRHPARSDAARARHARSSTTSCSKQVEGNSILLEEYARELIRTEEQHLGEVDKMLRKPGDIGKAG